MWREVLYKIRACVGQMAKLWGTSYGQTSNSSLVESEVLKWIRMLRYIGSNIGQMPSTSSGNAGTA